MSLYSMNICQYIVLSTGVLLCTACAKDRIISENYVDEDLDPYFERFVQEAALRGVDLQEALDLISGYIEEIEDGSVSGQCRHLVDAPDKVVIDRDFWNVANDNRKEFLVFHELGHCMLGRSHLDTKDRNGMCVSIMHSSSDACVNAYSYSTRSAYLDELFTN